MAAARAVPGVEILSVDSMQVYRGMDIGTAKPTPAERAEVRHHLIDLVDPWEEVTVAAFQRAYRDVSSDLAARGVRALLVGGTGLYLRAVVDQLTLPGEWPELRRRLEAEAAEEGPHALHARLAAVDPAAAAKMEPTNTRRIVRALEVCLGSGRPFSSFGPGVDTYPPTDVVQLALGWDRPALAARIADRVQRMMAAGLLDEVRALVADPRGLSRTAAQALGYKELIEHLEGRWTLDEAVAAIVTRTRQLAARQERWFRRDPRVRWVHVASDPVAEALPVLLEALTT
jgi:tRNA dimethylallyltransferase